MTLISVGGGKLWLFPNEQSSKLTAWGRWQWDEVGNFDDSSFLPGQEDEGRGVSFCTDFGDLFLVLTY